MVKPPDPNLALRELVAGHCYDAVQNQSTLEARVRSAFAAALTFPIAVGTPNRIIGALGAVRMESTTEEKAQLDEAQKFSKAQARLAKGEPINLITLPKGALHLMTIWNEEVAKTKTKKAANDDAPL